VVHTPRLHASSGDDGETLVAAIVRAARTARWRTLVACAAIGAVGVPAGFFISAHRVLLVSAAIAIGSFGSGGLADRILRDERSTSDPDRVLVVGFTIIRWLSAGIGTGAAIVCLIWVFFRSLGTWVS
jgi:hypothetical protein